MSIREAQATSTLTEAQTQSWTELPADLLPPFHPPRIQTWPRGKRWDPRGGSDLARRGPGPGSPAGILTGAEGLYIPCCLGEPGLQGSLSALTGGTDRLILAGVDTGGGSCQDNLSTDRKSRPQAPKHHLGGGDGAELLAPGFPQLPHRGLVPSVAHQWGVTIRAWGAEGTILMGTPGSSPGTLRPNSARVPSPRGVCPTCRDKPVQGGAEVLRLGQAGLSQPHQEEGDRIRTPLPSSPPPPHPRFQNSSHF